jgi:anti-sigma B factor antagonist
VFECRLTRSDDTAVARLHGELDLAGAHVLDDCLDAVIDERPPRVIIDLRGLEFMGSAGLHAFSRLRQGLGAHTELLFVPGPERVQRVFEITGVADTLRFVAAEDVAAELAG